MAASPSKPAKPAPKTLPKKTRPAKPTSTTSGAGGPLHILKLCVGCDSIEDLANWQKQKRAERAAKGEPIENFHVTRQTPKREAEVLDGGSIYWVIKGQIAVRQRILALRPVTREDVPHCAIMLDAALVPVAWRPCRAFQGWRYLKPEDAPRDLRRGEAGALPEALRAELAALGLL
jgi:hypothetical protein